MVGAETRTHSDLDVAIDQVDLPEAERRLAAHGFAHAADVEPGLPARYVLRDDRGRQVDLHVLAFEDGDGWQTLPDGSRGRYPGSELGCTGKIGGLAVPCISPALQLRHHLGYEPTDRDRHDMQLLATAFGFRLPAPLQHC